MHKFQNNPLKKS